MNNLGISIKVNGKQICKAGFDIKNFVLTPMVTLVHSVDGNEEFTLYVGGLDPKESEYVNWHSAYLSPGDTVRMEVIQKPFDQPIERKPVGESLEFKLNRYYALKEELKGYINEE